MIVGIGSDIVEHDLNTKLINWDTTNNLPKRILSEQELSDYLLHPTNKFLAGRFAAKEAVLKCLGTGMLDGLSLKDINITKLTNGQPNVILTGTVQSLAMEMGINKWHISITHSTTASMAFAIAESINL